MLNLHNFKGNGVIGKSLKSATKFLIVLSKKRSLVNCSRFGGANG